MSGIVVCGLNGSGKSTFANALAKQLDWEFVDIEDCFFPKDDPEYLYSNPRSREEATAVLLQRVREPKHFVLASVKADYGREVEELLTLAVWLRADSQTRAKRVREGPTTSLDFGCSPAGICTKWKRISSPSVLAGRRTKWKPGSPPSPAPPSNWMALSPSKRIWTC